jgi:hypothetical protein
MRRTGYERIVHKSLDFFNTLLPSRSLFVKPGWRNWQTQRTQNPPTFGSWGFNSPSRHHFKNPVNTRLASPALCMRLASAAGAADFAPIYDQLAFSLSN